MATSYTIDSADLEQAWLRVRAQLEQHTPTTSTYPIRNCASCGRDASQVDAETLMCIHCGGNPFVVAPVTRPFADAVMAPASANMPEYCDPFEYGSLAPAENRRTPDGGSRAYRALLDEAWHLHIAKNVGYAGHSADPWANFRQCEAFGISAVDGVLTRMSDKWSRLQSLWQNPERDRVGESIEDTLKDLAAYALILVCLQQEEVQP